MSGISTGIGLASGIDTGSLIDQLLRIEARPQLRAQQRLIQLQTQQSAYLDLNSRLLSLKNSAAAFNNDRTFDQSRAVSSDESKIVASASAGATQGAFKFTVDRLVSTQQRMSRGFADNDTTGLNATEFSFEVGGGRVDSETALNELRGGAGVSRGTIRITDSAGATTDIDLTRAVTIDDVLDAINSNTTVSVSAAAVDHHIEITDNAGGVGAFTIQDLGDTTTAADLNIAGSVAAGGALGSGDLIFLTDDTPLAALNDGNGVTFRPGSAASVADFKIELRDSGAVLLDTLEIRLGDIFEVGDADLDGESNEFLEARVVTIADLKARIDSISGGEIAVTIAADGRSLDFTATTGGNTITFTEAIPGETFTLDDLGLTGQSGATANTGRLIAGLNSLLAKNLNGGAGVSAGSFDVQRRDGGMFTVAVVADDSVQDIIDKINTGGAGVVTAKLNGAGNGLTITDTSTGADLIIADTAGTAAADLGIATAGESDGIVESGNLQHQYITRATLLANLNAGQGIGTGSFVVTDSTGKTSTVNITDADKTIDDVLRSLSGAAEVDFRINDNGDGLVVIDTATGGTQALTISDTTGSVARRLNLAGEAEDPLVDNSINGSFERTVKFEASDTLGDIAQKINLEGIGVDATIVNTGSGFTPFRLVLTSETSGSVGKFIVDTNGLDLSLDTVTEGRDAVVFFGNAAGGASAVLTSSTNTLDNVITGLTLDLVGTSNEPVEVVVARDLAAMESTVDGFVSAFNDTLDRIDFHTRFDSDTEERGVLLGDVTAANVRSSLFRTVQGRAQGVDGEFQFLTQVGVRIGPGARLEFDRDRFRSAFEQNPEAVKDLIAGFSLKPREDIVLVSGPDPNDPTKTIPLATTPNTGPDEFTVLGVAEQIERLTNQFTTTLGGLLTRRNQSIDNQIQLQRDRIANFGGQLDRKRLILEQQFLAMEQAISSLQSQSNALGSLGALAG